MTDTIVKRTNLVGFMEPVYDLIVKKVVSKDNLEKMGFKVGYGGGWIGTEFKEKAREAFQSVIGELDSCLGNTGGTLPNTFKDIFQYIQLSDGHREQVSSLTTVFPYELTGNSGGTFKSVFGNGCKIDTIDSSASKVAWGGIIELYVFIDEKGERYFYSPHNEKMKFPDLDEDAAYDKIFERIKKYPKNENFRFLIEGFPFYTNPETFDNILKASKKLDIPTDLFLSNQFKLTIPENAKRVMDTIGRNEISNLIGNEGEFITLLKSKHGEHNDLIRTIEELEIKLKAEKDHKQKTELKKQINEKQKELFEIVREKKLLGNTTAIITRGSMGTFIIDSRFENVVEVAVKPLENSKIKNTNGAGDACAAGIYEVLSKSLMDKNGKYSECVLISAVQKGHQFSREILQKEGATCSNVDEFAKTNLGQHVLDVKEWRMIAQKTPTDNKYMTKVHDQISSTKKVQFSIPDVIGTEFEKYRDSLVEKYGSKIKSVGISRDGYFTVD